MDYPIESDLPQEQPEGDVAALENRISQADNVGEPIQESDGSKTAVLDHIPFDKDVGAQSDYIREQSNLAAMRGADRLEYFLANDYAKANEIGDGDMLGLGFQKTETNVAGTTWQKPVIR